MLKAFVEFLGGEEGEERQIWMLLGLGFCMGVFLATYQVGSESLFLQGLGEDYLDKAFFVTGALGIITTGAFVTLQKRIAYSTLVIGNAFIIFLFIAGSRLAFYYWPDGVFQGFPVLPFALFVSMGPITAITLLGFWGIFGRMFDTRQAKRIIGGIDTGQLTATMIAFFSIPLITRFLPFIDTTYDLLFVAGVAAFGVLYFTIWVSLTWNLSKSTRVEKGDKVQKVNYLTILKDPYTRILSIFLFCSVTAAVFVDYTFYSTTEVMFTDPETDILDEQQLNDFLSFFSGTIMIMSFIIQSFINDIIIGRFGLKIALMTMPVILILFTVGGIVSGHIYGYETYSRDFLLFFMFTVSAKAFTASLRDALESPAFKLFFLPFNIKVRVDIQTRIEGVVNQTATLIAGGAQILLGFLAFFKLIHYTYLVIGLAFLVIWVSYKLYNEYKKTLVKTLQVQKEEMADSGKRNEHTTIDVLKTELREDDPEKVLNALRIFEIIDPIEFEFTLLDQLKHQHSAVRKYAYQKLNEFECYSAIEIIRKEVKNEKDEVVAKEGQRTVDSLQYSSEFELDDVSIRMLVRSTDPLERIEGARMLAKIQDDKHLVYVTELLRDINPEVRIAAMQTAGKIKRPEVWPILIENLHLATYGNSATSALVHTGEAAFHNIDTAFYRTGQYRSTRIRAIQAFGRVGGKRAIEMLWKKIDYPDRQIIQQLLLSLSYLGFEAFDYQASRLQLVIEALVSDIAWNIKVLSYIPEDTTEDKEIRNAIEEENKANYDGIFMILAMIYDPQNVLLVKENLEANTTDSVTFAIEMLDVFCGDELKPKLIPVLDDMKEEERLNKLLIHFAPPVFESYEDALKQIVNRDYNSISRFTKSLAINRLGNLEGMEVSYDLIANLFNPDHLLLQTAANAIYHLDRSEYNRHTRRLKPSIKKELDKAILPPVFIEEGEEYHQELLVVERIRFLKSMREFAKVNGELISFLAEALDEIRVRPGTQLIEKGDKGVEPIYIVVNGEIELRREQDNIEKIGEGQLVGEKLLLVSEIYDFDAVSTTTSTLLVLRMEEFSNLMSQHVELMETYVKILNDEFEKEAKKKEEFDMSLFT